VLREWVGLRPARSSGPRIEKEIATNANKESFAILHNYGHGGTGVSLSVCSAEAIVLLCREYLNV
jgi:hypothetical protein